jgi:tetratricopeptide (TPR) repeat protein
LNTAGNPLHCIELSRYAVAQKIARYVDGAWVLPEELPRDALPAGFEGMMSWALEQLSPDAYRFAEALSVHQGAFSLELCAALASELSEAGRLFPVLDELVSRGILTSSERGFSFSQAAVRTELLRELDAERKKRLHRKLAEVLLSENDGEFRTTIDAGWHLMHAGEETRGADLLGSIANSAHVRAVIDDDLHAAIPALEAALRVYGAQKRSLYEQAPLLGTLASAGFYVDWRLAERYGETAIATFENILGLALARKLRPWLGPRLSLAIGLVVARVRFGFARKRQGSFKDLIAAFVSCVTQLVGVSVCCLDASAARRYAEVLVPFRVLGKKLAPAGLYDYCHNLSLFADNRLAEAHQAFLRLLERLKDEQNYYRSLPAESRQLFMGGALYLLGVLESFRDAGETLRRADELDALGSKFYGMVAGRLRIAHHAYRGEMHLIEPYRERLDLHAMQFGSAWQVDFWAPAAMLTAYSNIADVVGVKLIADRLTNSSTDMSRMRLDQLAEGTHALLRGDTQRAIELLEDLRDSGHLRGYPGCTSSWGTLATAYNHAGKYEKAKALSESMLAEVGEDGRDFVVFTLKLELQLCLAEAGLGNSQRAAEMLDVLLEKYGRDRGPVTRARLHQTRARVANLAGDVAAFQRHLDAMGEAAKATDNPSLIAQWKRMARRRHGSDGLGSAPAMLGHTADISAVNSSRLQLDNAPAANDAVTQASCDTQTIVAEREEHSA